MMPAAGSELEKVSGRLKSTATLKSPEISPPRNRWPADHLGSTPVRDRTIPPREDSNSPGRTSLQPHQRDRDPTLRATWPSDAFSGINPEDRRYEMADQDRSLCGPQPRTQVPTPTPSINKECCVRTNLDEKPVRCSIQFLLKPGILWDSPPIHQTFLGIVVGRAVLF